MVDCRLPFCLSYDSLAALKRLVHQRASYLPSSHLSEALARGFGFLTNAALQAQLNAATSANTVFDSRTFCARLVELGHRTIDPLDVHEDARLAVWRQSSLVAPAEDLSRSALDRCYQYGVRIMRKANGDVFAHHGMAGVVGPCHDEVEAAELACATWGL